MGTNLGPNILDTIFFIGVIIFAGVTLYRLFFTNRKRFIAYAAVIIGYIGLFIAAIQTASMFLIFIFALLAFPFFGFLWNVANDDDLEINENKNKDDESKSVSKIHVPMRETHQQKTTPAAKTIDKNHTQKLDHNNISVSYQVPVPPKASKSFKSPTLQLQQTEDTGRYDSFVVFADGYVREGLQNCLFKYDGIMPEGDKYSLFESLNKRAAAIQAAAKVEVVERDGRFIAYNNGTVLDEETNLMWADSDNGSNISWGDAKDYCENYCGGGYTDWRMPTSVELNDLCQKGHINDDGLFTPRLIKITNEYVWAKETKGFYGANYSFHKPAYNWDDSSETDARALPVRSKR